MGGVSAQTPNKADGTRNHCVLNVLKELFLQGMCLERASYPQRNSSLEFEGFFLQNR